MKNDRTIIFPIAVALVALATVAAYLPGLQGSFLFDDFGNLPPLGSHGPIDNWPAFWRYITSGGADPTGRPLTMLTFLLNARDWPADPEPFLRTNLLLHLLNGVLLTLLLRQLGRRVLPNISRQRIDLAAVLGAGFWLLHPLFVSTTLYIVQREAMLPATFILLGLLAWLIGRSAMLDGRTRIGLLWIAAGLGACTILGTLCKANGILLPTLALVIEYTLLRTAEKPLSRTHDARQSYGATMAVFAWLPTIVISGYLLRLGWQGFSHPATGLRPWTLGQRLLTEPRVLMHYLDLLWLPRPFTPGLFNDQTKASTSLLSPWTTLPSIIAVLAFIVGSWRLRRRWPTACTALLFFFVGQSMESSTISLELYFEHRNYLPAMLMFWPLALWLCGVRKPRQATGELTNGNTVALNRHLAGVPARAAIAIVVLAGLALMTHARAQLWGESQDQALFWATLNPTSPRAQTYAAVEEMAAGAFWAASRRLDTSLTGHPEQVQLAFNLIDARCHLGGVEPALLKRTRIALRTTRDPGSLLIRWFDQRLDMLKRQPCSGLTRDSLRGLLHAATENTYLTNVAGRRQDLDYLQGRLDLSDGNGQRALADFNHALDQQVRPAAALKQAALLGSAGLPQLGMQHLQYFEAERDKTTSPPWGMARLHAWVLRRQFYWPHELQRLRHQLTLDAVARSHNTAPPSAAQDTSH